MTKDLSNPSINYYYIQFPSKSPVPSRTTFNIIQTLSPPSQSPPGGSLQSATHNPDQALLFRVRLQIAASIRTVIPAKAGIQGSR
jgi:hypothetical protein